MSVDSERWLGWIAGSLLVCWGVRCIMTSPVTITGRYGDELQLDLAGSLAMGAALVLVGILCPTWVQARRADDHQTAWMAAIFVLAAGSATCAMVLVVRGLDLVLG